MKKKAFVIFAIFMFFMNTYTVRAEEVPVSYASATPNVPVEKTDERVTRLTLYLEMHNSPMTASAGHFVSEADRLGLDWKLVAAIAGVESTFGKHVPFNSYNGWGWGIFTGQNDGIHFKNWNHGITTVSEGLKKNYIDRGATTIEQIGRIYAASPTWSIKVRFFLNQIDNFAPSKVSHLAVTI